MATVDKDTTRTRTPCVVRWRDETGTQRKKGFARKTDADRFRAEVEHSLKIDAYVDHRAGRQTFREYAEAWRAAQPHRPNTASNTQSRLLRHIYPAIGARPIAAVRPSELQAFVSGLPVSPSSIRPIWGTLRAIFAAAVRDRLIGRDPCIGVKLPKVPHLRVVPTELEQVEALVGAVEPCYRALLAMDAGTGLRQGEAFGVLAEDGEGLVVDYLRKTLLVQRQIQPRPHGGGVVMCALKNRASYRTIPVGEVVVGGLAQHVASFPPVEVEVVDETVPSKPVTRKVRPLFTDAAGQPLSRDTFNPQVWRPACVRAADALRKAAAEERHAEASARLRRLADAMVGVTMHDLRHWFASALKRRGLNVKLVAERLGHADASMTLKVYVHLFPDDEDRSRQAIDDAFKIQSGVLTVRPAIGS
jgi:integrase